MFCPFGNCSATGGLIRHENMPTTPRVSSSSPHEISPLVERTMGAGRQPAGVPAHRSVEVARRMFEHLESIHTIQTDIASQHQALENVELGVDSHFKAKRPEAGHPHSSSHIRHPQHHSGISGLQEPGSSSESVRQQFLNRQAAVSGLMSKLSELSVALNQIHGLGVEDSPRKSPSQSFN